MRVKPTDMIAPAGVRRQIKRENAATENGWAFASADAALNRPPRYSGDRDAAVSVSGAKAPSV